MEKRILRIRRQKRVRAKINGTIDRPRLNVFKSNKHFYAQLIDDVKSGTLVQANDIELKEKNLKKTEEAFKVGELLAKKALDKKISKAVFDRAGYEYTGRIKSAAEGARKGGLLF